MAKALGGLDELDEPASWGCGEAEPPKAGRLRSLYEFLREVPEFRKPRGCATSWRRCCPSPWRASWRGFGERWRYPEGLDRALREITQLG